MRLGIIAALVISLVLAASSASAIINPTILKRQRDRATEKLVVKVLKVTTTTRGRSTDVRAKARVVRVRESQSGLKKGDVIAIKYTSTRLPKRATGAIPTPIISKGVIGAYLRGSKGTYAPAARHYSFTSAKAMRNLKIKPQDTKKRVSGRIRKVGGPGEIDSRVVRRIVKIKNRGILRCYEKALKSNPKLKGRLGVKVVIETSGRAGNVEVTSNALDDRVANCVTQTLRRWRFPQPTKDSVWFTYDWVFGN